MLPRPDFPRHRQANKLERNHANSLVAGGGDGDRSGDPARAGRNSEAGAE